MFSLAISSMPSCLAMQLPPDRGGQLRIGLRQGCGEEAVRQRGQGLLVHGGADPNRAASFPTTRAAGHGTGQGRMAAMDLLHGLLARKPIDPAEESGLKRTLGAPSLVALGIGAIIGAGLFSLTGIAAGQYAGPAVVISFAIAGFGCALTGLCYSELAAMIPSAGSAYGLRLRGVGRGGRLDHRVGPDPGILGGGGDRRGVLVQLCRLAAARVGLGPAALAGRLAVGGRGGKPAGGRHHRRAIVRAGGRHRRIGAGQRGDRGGEGRHRADGDRRRRVLREGGKLPPVHPRQYRQLRRVRLVRHPSRGGGGVLRLSRLRTPSAPRRARRRGRRSPCPPASSARWRSARCCTSRSPWC